MLWLLLILTAWATPGLDALSAGDSARFAGDRVEAVARYREAIAAGEPAAEAMARLRMLSLTGNWGLMAHGPGIDRALFAIEGPWAYVAWADYHLFAPAQVGASREEALRLAQAALPFLPGPAMARLYLATGDEAWLAQLAELEARDGLGQGLLDHGGALWPDPGTWFLGLGFAGAPGAGVGGGLVFAHPDLAFREWTVSANLAATTRGTVLLAGGVRSPGRLYGSGGALLARSVVDVYVDEERKAVSQRAIQASLGAGLRVERWRLALGAQARWDDVGAGLLAAHGPTASAVWDRSEGWGDSRRGVYAGLSGSWALPPLSDYESLSAFADARAYVGALRGVSAFRLTWAGQAYGDAPFFALPAAGGAELHRGAWAGRYRAPWIATADVEQRWMLVGPLEAALFVNAAYVADDGSEDGGSEDGGLHPGGGAGLRLLLPPQRFNVVRVDLAVSDSGWGVYTGWGETF